jgi:pimeloyl-ACP methyl ester carboxylesterase
MSLHPLQACTKIGRSLGTTERRTRVLGTEVFHEELGEGRPLVLLHGLNDSHRTWRKLLPELAQGRRVLVPDLPGCGLSDRPDACYSLDWQAKVVDAWLGQLGIARADVVGHSYGGGVAQYMLLQEHSRIERLALIASGGLGREVSFELRLASLPWVVEHLGQPFMAHVAAHALRAVGGVLNADEALWLSEVNARPGTARAFARTVRDVINVGGQRRHFLDRAREIKAFPPIALYWGRADRVIPYAHALSTRDLLGGARLTTFDDCGHFPHHEQPVEVAHALMSFFDDPSVPCVRFRPARPRSKPSRASHVSAALRVVMQSLAPRSLAVG